MLIQYSSEIILVQTSNIFVTKLRMDNSSEGLAIPKQGFSVYNAKIRYAIRQKCGTYFKDRHTFSHLYVHEPSIHSADRTVTIYFLFSVLYTPRHRHSSQPLSAIVTTYPRSHQHSLHPHLEPYPHHMVQAPIPGFPSRLIANI